MNHAPEDPTVSGRDTADAELLTLRIVQLELTRTLLASGRSVVLVGEHDSGRSTLMAQLADPPPPGRTVLVLHRGELPGRLAHAVASARREGSDGAPLVIADDLAAVPSDAALQLLALVRDGSAVLLGGLDAFRVAAGDEDGNPFLDLWASGGADRVDLPPLSDEEADTIITRTLAGRSLDGSTRAAIRELASGSPMLLRELVHSTVGDEGIDPVRLAGLDPAPATDRIAALLRHRMHGLDDAEVAALLVLGRVRALSAGRARELVGTATLSVLGRRGHLLDRTDGVIMPRPLDVHAARARIPAPDPSAADRAVEILLHRRDDDPPLTDFEAHFVADHLEDTGPAAVSRAIRRHGRAAVADVFLRAARKANTAALPWRALAFARRGSALVDTDAGEIEAAIALAAIGRPESVRNLATAERGTAVDVAGSLGRAGRVTALLERLSRSDAARYVERTVRPIVDDPRYAAEVAALRLATVASAARWDQTERASMLVVDPAVSLPARLRALGALATSASARGDGAALGTALALSADLLRTARRGGAVRDVETRAAEVVAVWSLVWALVSAGVHVEEVDRLALDLQTTVLEGRDDAFLSQVGAVNGFAALARGDRRAAAVELDAARSRRAGGDPGWSAWLDAIRALVHLQDGRVHDARRLIDAALDDAPPGSWWLIAARSVEYRLIAAEGGLDEARDAALAVADAISGAHLLESLALFDAVRYGADPSSIAVRLRGTAMASDLPHLAHLADAVDAVVAADADAAQTASLVLRDDGDPLGAEYAITAALRLRSTDDDRRTRSATALLAGVREQLGRSADAHALSEREVQVARLAAGGLPDADIAARLLLPALTVESDVHRVLEKLGGSERRDLADLLVAHGIEPPTG